MLKKAGFILDKIIDFFGFCACFLTAVIVALMAVNVFTRYFLNRPIMGVEQITEYLIAAIGFWSAAWVLKQEGHVTMDFVLIRLKEKPRSALNSATSFLCAIVCILILWGGAMNIFWYWERGIRANGRVIEIPLSIVMSIMPIGFLVFTIQFLRRAKKFLDASRGPAKEERRKFSDFSDLSDFSDI